MRFAVVAHRASATNTALVDAARSCGLEAMLVEPRRALQLLEPGDVALARLDVCDRLDGVESGLAEIEHLLAGGVEVLNPPGSLVVAHDKLLTARALRLAGLPHPHTSLIAGGAPATAPEVPLVLKPRFGGSGGDVVLCRSSDELRAALERVSLTAWFREHGVLAQELVEPRGRDLRLVVAGERVVGATRGVTSRGERRTNAALGADVEPVDAPALARTLAIAAARAVRADLVGVDLLPTRSGFVVLELSGAVDFRSFRTETTDIHVEAVLALLDAAVVRRTPVAVPAGA